VPLFAVPLFAVPLFAVPLFAVPLFTVHCSLFTVHCSLFTVPLCRCSLCRISGVFCHAPVQPGTTVPRPTVHCVPNVV